MVKLLVGPGSHSEGFQLVVRIAALEVGIGAEVGYAIDETVALRLATHFIATNKRSLVGYVKS